MIISQKQVEPRKRQVEKLPPVEEREIDRRMVTLIEIGRRITSSLILEEVLQLTLEWATQIMDAEAGSVILLDKASDELVIKIATGPKGQEAQGQRFRKGEGIAGWVAETGEPKIVTNVRQDRHFFNGIDRTTGFATQSILAVPLRVRGETIGVLELLNKRDGQSFDDNDMKFFTTFADLAAVSIDNAGAYEDISMENRRLRMHLELERAIIGRSPAMRKVIQQIERVARLPVTVLLQGETGTGKGLIARVIHDRSVRRNKPFVTVDCGAMPEGLWESELFGYKKGAFTGAVQDKKGLFEAADGGTIFLDEIGDTPINLQARLLRVLQDGEIRRVGETQVLKVDVRMIAATNRDLERAMKEEMFRQDLFFRLNVVPIVLPALRERIEDISFLVDYFIEKHNQELDGRIEEVSPEAMQAILAYSWPGNIRELENVIKRLIVTVEEGNIRLEHLPPEIRRISSGVEEEMLNKPLSVLSDLTDHTLEGMERSQIAWALDEAKGNQSEAARLLGISREKLRYRMRKYGIGSGNEVVHNTQ